MARDERSEINTVNSMRVANWGYLDGVRSLQRWLPLVAMVWLSSVTVAWAAGPVVPGTGKKIAQGGDDFEDPNWTYRLNLPKSSEEQDKNIRLPGGSSSNGRWSESAKRGTPDVVRRVAPPEGGIPGSNGAMLMRTLWSMVPNTTSSTNGQDDLLFNFRSEYGGQLPVSMSPSVVTHVYLPPFEDWEPRMGNSFGFRAGVRTTTTKEKATGGWLFRSKTTETVVEPYWPGMFFCFWPKGADPRYKDKPSAMIMIRGDRLGHDTYGQRITEPGWWTLGMSFTPDGMVHYYAHAGVQPLTAKDHIVSYFPYSFKCEYFQTFFYDIMNLDNGKSWSTPWVVDDPQVYVLR